MKRVMLNALLLTALSVRAFSQNVAVKTNLLYWCGATANAGIEVGVGARTTIELTGVYNPWTLGSHKARLWGVQPEYRHWFCERFEGGFVGVHAHGGQFYGDFWTRDICDGWFVGGGVSIGYAKLLSPHWNIEFEGGLGCTYAEYDKSDNLPCERNVRRRTKTMPGVTRLSLSLVYLF